MAVVVYDEQRYKKLRLLTKKLNSERKKQAKKTDILCNDLIAAQRNFLKRLNAISFKANFCESIVGTTDLSSLLCLAGKLIREQIPDASIAFFLRQQEGFELHLVESGEPIALGREDIENCFTPELVAGICRSNKICTLDDMFAMGLQGNLIELGKISAVTIPLEKLGLSVGFVLIYRPSPQQLTSEELGSIAAVAPALCRAIESCLALSHSAQ
jgi:hypothetical protein